MNFFKITFQVVYPMSKAATQHKGLKMQRIYPETQTLTSTGRVSCHEPNIQNVPKDFEFEVTPQLLKKALGSSLENSWCNKSSFLMSPYASFVRTQDLEEDTYKVSLRKAFIASEGCLIIAADYSQLELRILAHLSQDEKLLRILGPQNPDVFKAMASKWKKKPLEAVEATDRQQVKQITYGILYGIGVKALSEQLNVEEHEAMNFISTFMETYPGVKKFIEKIVSECKVNGFVQTLQNRKRFLPNIKSTNTYAQAAAERQAVNSTVQGSAADLVKAAMISIDQALTQKYPNSKPLRMEQRNYLESGAHFILQLHDELYYEVVAEDLMPVAKIIKEKMEGAMEVKSVPFPVTVRIGPSWGELAELIVDE